MRARGWSLIVLLVVSGCGRVGFREPVSAVDGAGPDGSTIADAGPKRDASNPEDSGGPPPTPADLVVEEMAPYDFGSRPAGTRTPHAFTVVNAGGTTASNVAVEELAPPFEIVSDGCAPSVAPAVRCSIVVEFAPTGVEDVSAVLRIRYDDSRLLEHELHGAGAAADTLQIIPSGLSILPDRHWQFGGAGGTPPYRFTVLSGGGTVSTDGRFVAPTGPGSVTVRIADDGGDTADATIAVVDSYESSDRMCLGELGSTLPAGRITDSNNNSVGDGSYENGEDCQYVIRPDTATSVQLIARSWDVERGGDFDYLDVHDGPRVTSPRIGHFNGDEPLVRTVASSGAAYLHWVTDRGAKFPGYEIAWLANWSMEPVLVAHPKTVDVGGTTKLTVNGGVGPYAFEIVVGGGRLTSVPGNPTATTFIAGTDPSPSQVRVTDADGRTADATIQALDYIRMCVTTSTSADAGGIFDSGGFGGTYADGESCELLIAPGLGMPITLRANRFRVEGEGIVGFGPFDTLEVFDGPSVDSPRLGTFEGNDFNADVVAASGSMLLRWTSDGNVVDHGFDLNWR